MTNTRIKFPKACLLLVTGLLAVASVPTFADDDPKPKPSGEEEKPERSDKKRDGDRRWSRGESPFDSLSDSEKAELRAAMDAVWHDPAVLAARGEMAKAGDAYREALRKSMENTNPKIREILTKMMEGHTGGGWGHRGDRRPGEEGPPPPDGGPGKDKEPPFFKSLTEEDRQILRDAKAKADEDEAVKAAIAKKDAATSSEEKIEALRELREALHKAMLAADPRVGEVLSKLPVPGRDRGSRERREGGDKEKEKKDGEAAPDKPEASAGPKERCPETT